MKIVFFFFSSFPSIRRNMDLANKLKSHLLCPSLAPGKSISLETHFTFPVLPGSRGEKSPHPLLCPAVFAPVFPYSPYFLFVSDTLDILAIFWILPFWTQQVPLPLSQAGWADPLQMLPAALAGEGFEPRSKMVSKTHAIPWTCSSGGCRTWVHSV